MLALRQVRTCAPRPGQGTVPHKFTILSSQRRECLLGCGDRPLNVVFRVRRTQKGCLILGRRQVDATVEHMAEEFPKLFRIGLRRRTPIRYWPRIEEKNKHRTHENMAKCNFK